MTFARIFLILSLINFARAAPVVIREVQEVYVNAVDAAEDGSAPSQKPRPRDDWLATAAGQTSAPMTPRLPNLGHSGLHSPRSSTRSNNALSSSTLSTGPHPRWKDVYPPSIPWSPDHSPIPWGPDQAYTPSPDYSPIPWVPERPLPLSPDNSPPSLSTDHSPLSIDYSPPDSGSNSWSPEFSPPSSWSTDYSPPNSWSTDHSPPSISYSPPTSWLTDHPPPSPLPSSPGWSTAPHQSTDGYPAYPPPNPEQPDPAVSESESQFEDFLDKLLKGKIRRRISGSGAVDLAQNEV